MKQIALFVLCMCVGLGVRGETLFEQGREIFRNETFAGNGRTCATCHREANNFTVDAEFIATLPPSDPLFVAETVAELEGLENPQLLREFGLILENTDGFENSPTFRATPHLLGLTWSHISPEGIRLGWGGDAAPTLRDFANSAIRQHLTKTLARVDGVDFRLATDEEMDALEAYMLGIGRPSELPLPLALLDSKVAVGQALFMGEGRCVRCHDNGGANQDVLGEEHNFDNANFDNDTEGLAILPVSAHDDGFGTPGDGTFSTPSLVEVADTGPFFHNNALRTLEAAVAFYSTDTFNDSPAGLILRAEDPDGNGIHLDATQSEAIAAFLRALNAIENIRESQHQLAMVISMGQGYRNRHETERKVEQAIAEISDAIGVLRGGLLQPQAVILLSAALSDAEAARLLFVRTHRAADAITHLQAAHDLIEDF